MFVILCFIFFLSGASALIFELLWFQLIGLAFGSSVWAASIVLASFMGGLALGNGLAAFHGYRIKFPLRFYAFLEVLIAICGFCLIVALPHLTNIFVSIFSPFLDQPVILNVLRTIIAVLLILVPTTAMGATLTILVKALYTKEHNFGKVLGMLYGWNTLGGVIGVLLGEIFFIDRFGIRGTGCVAATCNIVAATIAFCFSETRNNRVAPTTFQSVGVASIAVFRFSSKAGRLLISSFLSGFVLLALEVVWFRFMIQFFHVFSLHYSIMLAVVLCGIGFGGLFTARWFEVRLRPHSLLVPIVCCAGILTSVLYRSFGFVLADHSLYHNIVIHISVCTLFLIFPVSFISGIIFTMFGRMLHDEFNLEVKAAGLLTMANTTGSMCGSLAAGLILIPVLGIERSLFALAFIYGVIVFLIFDKQEFVHSKRRVIVQYTMVGMLAVSLIMFPFGLMENFFSKITILPFLGIGEKRVAFKEGKDETIQYLQKDLLGRPYYYRLMTNSFWTSMTSFNCRRYMNLFAYLPLAVHPKLKNALVIGFGIGNTAKVLTDSKSLESIDIVDISKDVIEMSSVVFPDLNENPVHDPRVNIHIEDGRFFLLATKRTFDLITGEPPLPNFKGIVNLYTQEYFQLIYNRLSEGGIVTYWLPVHALQTSSAKSIVKAFSNVFEDCSLWAGSPLNWMLVGMKNQREKAQYKDFVSQWNDPVIGSEMRTLGFESPQQLGSLFIADGKRLQEWISDSLPLVDNYPKRLSSELLKGVEDLSCYIKFMDIFLCQENFMKSELIKQLWPEAIRRETQRHFATRQLIFDIFMKDLVEVPLVEKLHQCMNDHLLKPYIIWLLQSDKDAYKIIAETFKNKETVITNDELKFFVAQAVYDEDYLLAEQYLDRLSKIFPMDNTIWKLRMYLLFLVGEKERAGQVGREFINLADTGKAEIERQIKEHWEWLLDNLGE